MNRVLVIGDAIIDKYIYGEVTRISPEAPVPIVKQDSIRFQPGGALNVAKCLTALGCDVKIVCQKFPPNHMLKVYEFCSSRFTVDSNCPKKTRIIGNNHQICRIDEETCEHNFSSARYNFDLALERDKYDVVVISDYGKGLFSKKFAAYVNNTLCAKEIPYVVDSKVKEHYPYWAGAEWACPNMKEADTIFNFESSFTGKPFDIKNLCITMGECGAVCNGVQIPVEHPVDVVDVTGAGDVVVAVLGYLSQPYFDFLYPKEKVEFATILATESVKHHGCYAPTLDEVNLHWLKTDAMLPLIYAARRTK